jgi:hypothetical protein
LIASSQVSSGWVLIWKEPYVDATTAIGDADVPGDTLAPPLWSPDASGDRWAPTGAHAANRSVTAATSRGILIGRLDCDGAI